MERGIYVNGEWHDFLVDGLYEDIYSDIATFDHLVLCPNDLDSPVGTVTFAYLDMSSEVDIWEMVP